MPEKPKPPGDTITLRTFLSDNELTYLLSSAGLIIDRDLVRRRKLGDEKFELFKGSVVALLAGNELYVGGVRNLGLDPRDVLRKATSVLGSYRWENSRMRSHPPSGWDVPFRPIRGTDPWEFEDPNTKRDSEE